MDHRQRKKDTKSMDTTFSSASSSRMENEGGGNKGNSVQDEVQIAYNAYLQARCIQKFREYNMLKAKRDMEKKKLDLDKLEDQFELLRRCNLQVHYLAATTHRLAKLDTNLQSALKSCPSNILDDVSQIRNDLQNNVSQLTVKGAAVNPDESEQLMNILPRVKHTLEKLQDSIDNRDEVHVEVADKCTALVDSISRIMENEIRCNKMIDEVVSVALRISAMTILDSRNQKFGA